MPLSIFKAFTESRNLAKISTKALDPYVETGYLEPETRDLLSKDLFGYGIDDEELVLRTFGQYCYEQGYTNRALQPNEVFSSTNWM